ncbi:MAG: heavy metal-associated domain-containing protein [Bermanella sp.]
MAKTIQLSVPSMKCGGCATAISDALKACADVQVIEVRLVKKEVSVMADASSDAIIKLLAIAGFQAQEIIA